MKLLRDGGRTIYQSGEHFFELGVFSQQQR